MVDASIHVLSSLCRNGWIAIALNVATVVMTTAFAITLHLFRTHQAYVEAQAGIRNPYDGLVSITFWTSVVTAVLIAALTAYQVVRRVRLQKTLRR